MDVSIIAIGAKTAETPFEVIFISWLWKWIGFEIDLYNAFCVNVMLFTEKTNKEIKNLTNE